jgi:hypothetical protein
MRATLTWIHLTLGLALMVMTVNGQVIVYRKIHTPARYYSNDDLRNSGVADHLDGLKRSAPRRFVESGLAVALGVASVAGGVAFSRRVPWAVIALPAVTLSTIAAVFYTSRQDWGLSAAVAMVPIYPLSALLIVELRYVRRPSTEPEP